MSLRSAVAAPFTGRGEGELAESEFVVALSLDRDWFSPDQATRLADIAVGEGLLERTEGMLVPTFDPADATIPDGFVPDEELLRRRSAFEQVLDALVADGIDKREAVAEINELQQDLAVTIEAAAVLYARRRDIDVSEAADRALAELGD
ncbi:DUF2240 family protein [Halococcus thailandensis]|uniref:DUF2240 domain-containing protein n=1 Tax=Halococcus thailandensis JCM 13552 TaxID=1227457 RepID=M0N2A1_9EURY|nr:DUF2240 family protein [Halococcus thailandensis]EMA52052.1 hypothetical protein C451_12914 [Halococcus thailandensis JCM 13552]